jgi:hypothetical protein
MHRAGAVSDRLSLNIRSDNMSNFVEFKVYIDPKEGSQGGVVLINADHVTQIEDYSDHCGLEKDNGKTVDVCGTAAQALAKLKGA